MLLAIQSALLRKMEKINSTSITGYKYLPDKIKLTKFTDFRKCRLAKRLPPRCFEDRKPKIQHNAPSNLP